MNLQIIINTLINQMSQQQDNSSNEDFQQKLRKKYKKDTTIGSVNLNPQTDITQMALQRYDQIKKHYNFVSFEESNKAKSVVTAKVQSHSLPIHDFNQQMYQFRRDGFCSNPNTETRGLIFSEKNSELKNKVQLGGEEINENNEDFVSQLYKKTTKNFKKEITRKFKQNREKSTNALNYLGPWAGYGQDLQNGALTVQQRQMLERAQQRKKIRVQQAKKQQQNFQPYSTFHWKQSHDYKGKSFVDPPNDFKPNYGTCYLPKKDVHTWVSSQKAGYQVARFFPKVGHFILVGNPQGKVQLFDVIKSRQLAQTYVGHTKAVRDIQFTNDGKHFLSAAFDNQVHYWDTEYGKVLRTFKMKKIPFCVKFHPQSDKQSNFLCGSASKKIVQFDLNSGTKVLSYEQHLGTINTLTFIENKKFVSSSDDKKLFVWEYGIPVVIKHVSQPQMHTITATAMHPNGQYFAGQSSDNQVVIYQNKGGNFRRIRSKKIASHFCAGYACGLDFSYDGQFLASGDQRGRLFFYDWKTAKNYRTLEAHPSVCIGVQWHPSQPTKVVTCGWQGLVKLWQ